MGYFYPPFPPPYPGPGQSPHEVTAPQPYFQPSGSPPKSPAEVAAAAADQRLLLLGIMAVICLVHLPWLAYLVAIHGCWGSFLDLCYAAPAAVDDFGDLRKGKGSR